MHESNNEIEFHYGTLIEGTYNGDGASIGFKDLRGGGLRFYDLMQDKICYKDELIADLDPNSDWPGPDSCFIIKTYGTLTPIDKIVSHIPKNTCLFQNYPNPFNPKTVIGYQIPVVSEVELSIYNILGQKVAMLVHKKQTAGTYKVQWNASGFASGMYFIRFESGDFIKVRKCLLIK